MVLGIPLAPVIAGGIFVVTLFTGVVLSLQQRNIGRLIELNHEALQNRRVQDEAEAAYLRSSLAIKDIIHLLRAGVLVAGRLDVPLLDPLIDDYGTFLENVTDGRPNE